MAEQSLAVRYRPTKWDDLTEQESIKTILSQQLATNTIKNAYLFTGPAGCGKTTSARIFANEINKGVGNPIEIDAASNNSVDDVRELAQQAKTQSLDSEYKIFILDECHVFSSSAWQAMLKLIEEPPAKTIFIFATTNPEKIPRTILSRVQRYDFKKISMDGIVQRLKWICDNEGVTRFSDNGAYKDLDKYATTSALQYIAKIADGGMRDAITLMDKCLSYSTELTLENVVKALGTVDYDIMFKLTDAIFKKNDNDIIDIIESIYMDGKDIKQFIKDYLTFMLDVCKYGITKTFKYICIPSLYSDELKSYGDYEFETCRSLLNKLIRVNADVKYDSNPKIVLEASLLSD